MHKCKKESDPVHPQPMSPSPPKMSFVPRSNPKRLNDLFNGKDCEVRANVTLVGVGENVTLG